MKIIVTGGAGFIGGNFVYYELKHHADDQIICLDKLTYAGNLETLADAFKNPHFTFVKADIADRDAVYKLFDKEKPDIVVNFAAESHVDRSIEEPELFLRTNIIGTSVLLDACKKFGINRFHQVSTDEVYGDLPLDFQKSVFKALSCEKNIGLYLNESLLMVPTKSVTAIIGVSNEIT
mgnify:CR=1 FL=1